MSKYTCQNNRTTPYKLFGVIVLLIMAISCANRGTPSGGDYDLSPPVLVSSTPKQKALNVQNIKTINLYFDENVQLKNPSENVIITPPQKAAPRFTVINSRIKVDINDTLKQNTTYIIDFGDALEDNNEGNALENFVLMFSTGNQIDSLEISGKVLEAENLEPISSILVGLHSNLNDSAFHKLPFDRISRTNSKGEFVIRGLSPQKYRIYALKDMNRDYMYDLGDEKIAFLDTIIEPYAQQVMQIDTLLEQTEKADSISTSKTEKAITQFLPNDLILRAFSPTYKKKYLQKYDRPKANQIQFYFTDGKALKEIRLLGTENTVSEPLIREKSFTGDTIKYWISDDKMNLDTLSVSLTYLQTNARNIDSLRTDTLKMLYKKPQETTRKKDDIVSVTPHLSAKISASGSISPIDKIFLEFDEPISNFDPEKIKLSMFQKNDSTFVPLSAQIIPDSINPRRYWIQHAWQTGQEYKIESDSASFFSYSKLITNKISTSFKVKDEDEYAFLLLRIEGLENETSAFVELLNKNDTPVRRATVKNKSVRFPYLDPGTYYARIIIDANSNGKWDTGNFDEDKQPEMVYYSPNAFDMRANWDSEETWVINATPLDKQKPLEITKNKPVEKKTKQQQLLEQEQNKRKNSQQSSSLF